MNEERINISGAVLNELKIALENLGMKIPPKPGIEPGISSFLVRRLIH